MYFLAGGGGAQRRRVRGRIPPLAEWVDGL